MLPDALAQSVRDAGAANGGALLLDARMQEAEE